MLMAYLSQLISVEWWGVGTNAAAAIVTFMAVLVALVGWRFMDWRRRPRLEIAFKHEAPWCRKTNLDDDRQAYWIRLQVKNKGHNPARACIGKVTRVCSDGTVRDDIDPMRLRWCGVRDKDGFKAIHLAKDQVEFLNVLRLESDAQSVIFETFPSKEYAPGHPVRLNTNVDHTIEVAVMADNAEPASRCLTVRYDGNFGGLPNSIDVSIDN